MPPKLAVVRKPLVVPRIQKESAAIRAGAAGPILLDPSSVSLLDFTFKRQQQAIMAQVVRALELFWQEVDADAFMESMDRLQPVVDTMTAMNYHAAAASAAQYYISARVALGFGHRAVPGVTLEEDEFEGMFRATGITRFWNGISDGLEADEASAGALDSLTGGVTRLVMNGGRDQITEASASDPESDGWERIANDGACDFCASLAGPGKGDFPAHDHCQCTARPSFNGG